MTSPSKSQKQHNSPIRNVAWMPDSLHLCSGDDRGYLAISDARQGKILEMWQCHATSISALKADYKQPLLATASVDGIVRLWQYPDAMTGDLKMLGETRYEGEIAGLEFRPGSDGDLAIAAATGQVSLWRFGQAKPQDILVLPAQANSTAWSPDGAFLAVGCDDFAVYLIDVQTGEKTVFVGHTHHADQLGYSRCGRFVASGSHDKTVRVWDVKSGQSLAVLDHNLDTVKPDWAADGRLATCSYDQKVRVWDPLKGELLATLHGHTYDVDDVAWSPDCKLIASCGWDNRIVIFDGQDYSFVNQIEGGTHQVYAMAYTAVDTSIYAGTTAGRLFKISSPINSESSIRELGCEHKGVITSIDISPDGKFLASSSSDSTVMISDAESKQPTNVLRQHHNLDMEIARFSSCGQYLATGARDNSVTLYRLNGSGADPIWRYDHERRVKAISWDPNRAVVATGADGNIRLFDGLTGNLLRQWRGHERMINALCWSPTGDFIASASWDRTVKIFDLEGSLLKTFDRNTYNVNAIDIHPRGDVIASACWDGTISIWSVANGDLQYCWQAPNHSPVQLVRWVRNTDLLAAATWDGEVLLYKLQAPLPIAKWDLNRKF